MLCREPICSSTREADCAKNSLGSAEPRLGIREICFRISGEHSNQRQRRSKVLGKAIWELLCADKLALAAHTHLQDDKQTLRISGETLHRTKARRKAANSPRSYITRRNTCPQPPTARPWPARGTELTPPRGGSCAVLVNKDDKNSRHWLSALQD